MRRPIVPAEDTFWELIHGRRVPAVRALDGTLRDPLAFSEDPRPVALQEPPDAYH